MTRTKTKTPAKIQTAIDFKGTESKVSIKKELKDLIPPLSEKEFLQLEDNILKEGLRDPLIVWPCKDKQYLIDGHNRFHICQKHKLSYKIKRLYFESISEVKDWMINNQLGRRNLSKANQSYLQGLRYNREKQQGKRSDLTSGQNGRKSADTADRLAREFGVSAKTVRRDAVFAQALDQLGQQDAKLKEDVLKGKRKLNKSQLAIKAKSVKPKRSTTKKLTDDQIADIAVSFMEKERRKFNTVKSDLIKKEGRDLSNREVFEMWAKTSLKPNQVLDLGPEQ